jgi:hypothetical protein
LPLTLGIVDSWKLSSNALGFINAAVPSASLSEGSANSKPTQQHFTYVQFLMGRVQQLLEPPSPLTTLVQSPENMDDETILLLMTHVVEHTKDVELSIDGVIAHLINTGDLRKECSQGTLRDQARVVLFVIIGWMLLLYPPLYEKDLDFTCLRIDPKETPCLVPSISLSKCGRPLWENIRSFGDLLPAKSLVLEPHSLGTGDLRVATLNAKTLFDIGGISISWVACISSHLTFDAENRKLRVFALPSYCSVHLYEDTILARYDSAQAILRYYANTLCGVL